MNYTAMTINQLQDELINLNCKCIEIQGKMDAPCTNKDWLGMDATKAIYQEEITKIHNEIEIANLL